MFLCNFCTKSFAQKKNLKRHLSESCETLKDVDKLIEINDKLGKIEKMNDTIINGDHNVNINGNVGNIGNVILNVTINPITKLDTGYIEVNKMKKLIEQYNYPLLNYLLSDYIKDIIHHTDHPENHSVKYIKKKPPTFSSTINKEGIEGDTTNVITNLKDSCELLSEPMLLNLKQKLKECRKEYKNDEDFQDMYEDTVRELRKELNKESVKKALSNVLQTNILNDTNMKVNIDKPVI